MRWMLLALLLPSCINGRYYHIRREEPIPEARATALLQQQADLQTCLDTLGAPHLVFEQPRGLAMAYAWLDMSDWGIEVQIGYTNTAADGQTLFSFDSNAPGYDGIVLVFDERLRLIATKAGKLADITQSLRRPPAVVE